MQTTIDYIAMGKRIRNRRKELRLTQTEVAVRIGISPSFFGHLERGSRICSLETLCKLSAELNMTLDMIVCGKPMSAIRNHAAIVNNIMAVLAKYVDDWAPKQ